MSGTVVQEPVWRTLVQETALYCLRRFRGLIVAVGCVTLLAAVLAFGGQTEVASTALAGVVFYAPFIAALLVMSGIVSDELATGLIVMWFQKPGMLVGAYAIRYALYLFLLSAAAVVLAVIVGAISVSAGAFPLAKAVRFAPVMISVAVLVGAMVFGFSAWGFRRDSTVAFFVIVIGFSLAGIAAFKQAPLSSILNVIAFPLDAMAALGGSASGYTGVAAPIAIVLGQFVAWTAIGVAGLKYTERTLQS
jgi:hypothetical protein